MKGLLYLIIFCCSFGVITAQKIPNIQHKSILAPDIVKIDGNINEWGNQFQAFNKRQFLFYTVANDNEFVYFIIRCENSLITSKILAGGIKVTFNREKKKEKGAASITFPVVGQTEIRSINKSMPAAIADGLNKKEQDDALKSREVAIAKANSKNIDMYKTIRALGLQGVDSLISIYNEDKIKVGLKTDNKNALNYKLAVPLKYLGITSDITTPFYYNIKLLGKVLPAGLELHPIISQNGGAPLGPGGVDRRSLIADTDFWGEYILAKKP